MYKEIDDDEILYMINENDDNYKFIIEKYYPLIVKISKEFLPMFKETGYELDDLVQVASIGLINAVRSYKDNHETSFYTYMIHCIKNKLRNEMRDQKTGRKICLNKAISYYEILPRGKYTLLDILPDKNATDPYRSYLELVNEIEYINFLNSLPLEMSVAYEMRMSGFKYDEISLFLNMDKIEIYKLIKTARNKIGKLTTILKDN